MTWVSAVGKAVVGVVLVAGPVTGAVQLEVTPPKPSPGQLFQVSVVGISAHGSVELRLGSRVFALWQDGPGQWEGYAALDREESAPTREFFVVDTFPEGEQLLGVGEIAIEPRDYGSQEIKVDEAMVTLSAADQARAERENALIRSVLGVRSADRLWSGPFVLPTAGKISGPFGVRRIYNGKPKGYHNGVDVAAPRGSPVTASGPGRVALVGDYFYTGNTVLVDHGVGLYTAYFHMDSAAVVEGEKIEAGAVLGLVGSTGRSTGPHLHWGVYVSGVRADPASLLSATGGEPTSFPLSSHDPVSQAAGN